MSDTIPIYSTPTGETPPNERNRKSVSQKKLEKRVVRLTAQAITDFGMINEGDKVMVAMSGGKDSYVLLDTLKTLQSRAPIHFDLLAVNVHQHIPHFPLDELKRQLEASGVPYHIEDQDTNSLIQKLIPEGKNVCSLCARCAAAFSTVLRANRAATKLLSAITWTTSSARCSSIFFTAAV